MNKNFTEAYVLYRALETLLNSKALKDDDEAIMCASRLFDRYQHDAKTLPMNVRIASDGKMRAGKWQANRKFVITVEYLERFNVVARYDNLADAERDLPAFQKQFGCEEEVAQ